MTKKLELQNGRPKNVNFSGIGTSGTTSTKVADYTTTDADSGKVIPFDLSAGTLRVTLHAPTDSNFIVTFKDVNGFAATNNLIVLMPGDYTDRMADNYGSYTYMYSNSTWGRIANYNGSAPVAARGIFAGGGSNTIDYINLYTTSNATDFGDLTNSVFNHGACSSSIRGMIGGDDGVTNVIEYFLFKTLGNSVDFGDLTVARNGVAGCSSATRGLFGGGNNGVNLNTIDYITMATTGNAIDFGDLTLARFSLGSTSSQTRGLWYGGIGYSNIIDYVTVATTGNATDFGDLSINSARGAGNSNGTRAVMPLGVNSSAVALATIEYVTIATTSNSTFFGNLSVTRSACASASGNLKGVWAGGSAPGNSNVIDYVLIATLANATDFGDLTVARAQFAGCSNDHGGL